MSLIPSRSLPERPSLEQLRKQAREHLDTLRAANPAVKLAAAQHALAREYGFENWSKLVHHIESLQPGSRMLRPAALRSDEKLLWSPGRGTDLWALIQACIAGDLDAVRALIAKDPSLTRAHYTYRKPLYFAVRENRVDIAQLLLQHDRNPMDMWFDDSPLEIAHDRGYVEMERLLTETLDTNFNASSRGESIALACHTGDLARVREVLRQDPSLANRLGGYEGCYLGAGAPIATPRQSVGSTSCTCSSIAAPIPTCPRNRSRREARRSTKRSSTVTTRSRSSCSSAVRFRIRRREFGGRALHCA